MKTRMMLSILATTLPIAALAQQVPAIESASIQSTYMPAGIYTSTAKTYNLPVLSPDQVRLNDNEQKALSLSNQWKNKSAMPVIDSDGTVNFTYGATLPSVICAPLYACDVALQPGEIVTQVDVGDAPRWKVTPATSGSGDTATTHLIIKPSDVGLTSNMIINTNRRTYNIRLVSKKDHWMPLVAFSYPSDVQEQWAAYQEKHQQTQTLQAKTVYAENQSAAHAGLNFRYRIKGDNPNWKPLRVYSDTSKTYIQFPESARHGEIPALVILGQNDQEQLVNYRMVADRYVVDKIIEKAALITGVGRHQERVEIVREGT